MDLNNKTKKLSTKLYNILQALQFPFDSIHRFQSYSSSIEIIHNQKATQKEKTIQNLISMVNDDQGRIFIIEWLVNSYDSELLPNFEISKFAPIEEKIDKQKSLLSCLGSFKLGGKYNKINYIKLLEGNSSFEALLDLLINQADMVMVKNHFETEMSYQNSAEDRITEIGLVSQIIKNKENLFKKTKLFKWDFNSNEMESNESPDDIDKEFDALLQEIQTEKSEKLQRKKPNGLEYKDQQDQPDARKTFSEYKELMKYENTEDADLIESYSNELRKMVESIDHFVLTTRQTNLASILKRKEAEEHESYSKYGNYHKDDNESSRIHFKKEVLDLLLNRKVLKEKMKSEQIDLSKKTWKIYSGDFLSLEEKTRSNQNQNSNQELHNKKAVGKQEKDEDLKNYNIHDIINQQNLEYGYNIGKEF